VRRPQIGSRLPARKPEQARRSHNLLDSSKEEWLKKPVLAQEKKGCSSNWLEHIGAKHFF
jgi:hypothetical protein